MSFLACRCSPGSLVSFLSAFIIDTLVGTSEAMRVIIVVIVVFAQVLPGSYDIYGCPGRWIIMEGFLQRARIHHISPSHSQLMPWCYLTD